ncbi:MAG TPA: hypothetical protein VKE26_06270 [Xanthobacteraceae bacterium]|nr:hypothetical protein [Xanthobacteraceae bacterium]
MTGTVPQKPAARLNRLRPSIFAEQRLGQAFENRRRGRRPQSAGKPPPSRPNVPCASALPLRCSMRACFTVTLPPALSQSFSRASHGCRDDADAEHQGGGLGIERLCREPPGALAEDDGEIGIPSITARIDVNVRRGAIAREVRGALRPCARA